MADSGVVYSTDMDRILPSLVRSRERSGISMSYSMIRIEYQGLLSSGTNDCHPGLNILILIALTIPYRLLRSRQLWPGTSAKFHQAHRLT